MSTPDPNAPTTSAEGTPHRRSREEVEALAKSFVAAPTSDAAPAKPYVMKIAMGAGAVAVLAIITMLAWPKGQDPLRQQAAESANRVAADAEAARLRYEAERERVRQQLASGQDYLERMASADAALVKDMTERAENLAQRAAAFEDTAPTPREESTKVAAVAPAAPKPTATAPTPAPAKTTTAPAQAATAPPPQVASAAPAQAAPKPAAQKASCAIHVSELSSNGKLTYEDVKRMKGARFDEATGNVFTPPVPGPGYKSVVFEVFPNGCVKMVRSSLRR